MNLDGGDKVYIEVLVEVKSKMIDKTFTYRVPENLKKDIKVGIRVLVPFGNRKVEGFVLGISSKNEFDYDVKDIIDIVDMDIVLTNEMLKLGRLIERKTLSPLINVYQAMLPSALKAKIGFKINKKYEKYVVLNDSVENIDLTSSKQKEIVNLIKEKIKVTKKEIDKISLSALTTLEKKGFVKIISEEVYRLNNEINEKSEKVKLSSKQEEIVNEVANNIKHFQPYLLHGVTGSGKTEVYMSIIDSVVLKNKEAIVLVPEISLTPQMVKKFQNRFGSKVAILHSGLSDGEKYDEWRKIERKEVSIVIGARSAVFAPFTNIGVIIIDEEHSSTYKQESTPRYNAIDVSIWRGKYHNCPVLLGSATPSIESYTRAKLGVYKLLELDKRINNNLPTVHLIDMKQEIRKGNRYLSEDLISSIKKCFENGEQVILLLNRRGYSTVVSCHNCGYTQSCPNCDVALTYHKLRNVMSCHHCNYTTYKLKKCTECGSEDINEFGIGTQKLEEEIKKTFNEAKVVRMDVDTTSNKGSHERIIRSFENEEYNILVGTQMISKGLDFPKVTLVGVLNADSSLNIPDFRSAERTFQLLSQVSGRAGRSNLKGKVIIQTFNKEHYSIESSQNHDYKNFYNMEMNIREKLNYPPFCNLTLIKISGKNYDEILNEASKIRKYLSDSLSKGIIILGPSSASVPKVNNIYYVNIILKYKNTNEVMDVLKSLKEKYNIKKGINLEIDISPSRI